MLVGCVLRGCGCVRFDAVWCRKSNCRAEKRKADVGGNSVFIPCLVAMYDDDERLRTVTWMGLRGIGCLAGGTGFGVRWC